MKDKIVKILENGTEGNYLLTSGNIERIATQIAKLYQLAVSEGEMKKAFDNWANGARIRTEWTGWKYGIKWLQSLNVQGGAVSEDKLSEIFANHADNTPYLNFTAFKEAVKELLNPKR